jgi:hypothetical protein
MCRGDVAEPIVELLRIAPAQGSHAINAKVDQVLRETWADSRNALKVFERCVSDTRCSR